MTPTHWHPLIYTLSLWCPLTGTLSTSPLTCILSRAPSHFDTLLLTSSQHSLWLAPSHFDTLSTFNLTGTLSLWHPLNIRSDWHPLTDTLSLTLSRWHHLTDTLIPCKPSIFLIPVIFNCNHHLTECCYFPSLGPWLVNTYNSPHCQCSYYFQSGLVSFNPICTHLIFAGPSLQHLV